MRTRRALFATLGLIALTGTLMAQQPAPTITTISRVGGSPVKITAGRQISEGGILQMTDGMRLTIDGTTIVANEATVDVQAGEVKLSGDVRLKIR